MDKTKGLLFALIVLIALGLGYYFVVSRNTSTTDNIVSDNSQVDVKREQGEVLDETVSLSNYLNYQKEMLQESMDSGKVVLLYFTANWCPTCRAQEPINVSLFKNLKEDTDIVAYKVHILDDETTQEEEVLAKEYGVRLQHSFVLLDAGGEVVFTHTGPLTEGDLMKELEEAKKWLEK
jgi:thiol-disulfide isomerase/thioredoxin